MSGKVGGSAAFLFRTGGWCKTRYADVEVDLSNKNGCGGYGCLIVVVGIIFLIGSCLFEDDHEDEKEWEDELLSEKVQSTDAQTAVAAAYLLGVITAAQTQSEVERQSPPPRAPMFGSCSSPYNSGSLSFSTMPSSVGSMSTSHRVPQNRSYGSRFESPLCQMWKCRYCGQVVSGSVPPTRTCVHNREFGRFGPCVFDKMQ